MKTLMMLMAEYETPLIPLAQVCDKYLSVDIETARKRAARHELPFPCIRMGSNRSDFFIRIEDFAEFIDALANEQKLVWKKMNDSAA